MKSPKKRIQRLAEDAEALWADGYRKGYRAGQTAARGGPRVTRGRSAKKSAKQIDRTMRQMLLDEADDTMMERGHP